MKAIFCASLASVMALGACGTDTVADAETDGDAADGYAAETGSDIGEAGKSAASDDTGEVMASEGDTDLAQDASNEAATPPEPTVATIAAPMGTATPSTSATAGSRTVRCIVESGDSRYEGPCNFTSQRGGTFTVTYDDGSPGDDRLVTVAMLGSGRAEVRGLNENGINSRWGEAIRHQNDTACWVGSDFKVCAY